MLAMKGGGSDYNLVGGGSGVVARDLSGALDNGGALATGGLGGGVTRLGCGSRPTNGAGGLDSAVLA
jgi:hypothetical protein